MSANFENDPEFNDAIPKTMAFRKTGPRPFTDQDQPQDQRNGAGQDVRVERPWIHAPKMAFPTMQEVRRKIERKVVMIIGYNTYGNFEDQDDGQ